jgi:hypothetical protein
LQSLCKLSSKSANSCAGVNQVMDDLAAAFCNGRQISLICGTESSESNCTIFANAWAAIKPQQAANLVRQVVRPAADCASASQLHQALLRCLLQHRHSAAAGHPCTRCVSFQSSYHLASHAAYSAGAVRGTRQTCEFQRPDNRVSLGEVRQLAIEPWNPRMFGSGESRR